MRHLPFALLAAVFGMACEDATTPTEPDGAAPAFTTAVKRYSGRAVAVQTTIAGFTQTFVQAGPLSSSGGTQAFSLVSVKVEPILTANTLNASVDGRYTRSLSKASLADLTLKEAGHIITATKVSALARAECGYHRSGSSEIYRLTVDGAPVTLTGQPNQSVTLPNGRLVVNEQTNSPASNSIMVTGLRLIITGQVDIVVSQAQAGIHC